MLAPMARKKRSIPRKPPRATVVTSEAASLEQLVAERDFLQMLADQAAAFFRLANFLVSAKRDAWGENHLFSLQTEANALESFLDDFDARNNKKFSYFTEIVASVRGFANAAHALQHLNRRYSKYRVEFDEEKGFQRALVASAEWTNDSIAALLEELYKDVRALGVPIPREALGERSFPTAFARLRLPRTVDEEDVADEEQRIAEIATKFLKTCDIVDSIGIEQIDDPMRLRHFVARSCTEEKARLYEASVHNLQSKYDTYIKNTIYENKDPHLKTLRGHASVSLHLLEYVTHLVHFYERHENDIRYEPTKLKISRTIVKGEVLHHAVNFGLYYAARYLTAGRPTALAIFPAYTKLREETLDVPAAVDLHLRPAMMIAKVAGHYGTPVQMRIADGDWVDAASMIKVVMAIGMSPGARKVTFRADDAVLRDMRQLFDAGLGEEEVELPQQLWYLK